MDVDANPIGIKKRETIDLKLFRYETIMSDWIKNCSVTKQLWVKGSNVQEFFNCTSYDTLLIEYISKSKKMGL